MALAAGDAQFVSSSACWRATVPFDHRRPPSCLTPPRRIRYRRIVAIHAPRKRGASRSPFVAAAGYSSRRAVSLYVPLVMQVLCGNSWVLPRNFFHLGFRAMSPGYSSDPASRQMLQDLVQRYPKMLCYEVDLMNQPARLIARLPDRGPAVALPRRADPPSHRRPDSRRACVSARRRRLRPPVTHPRGQGQSMRNRLGRLVAPGPVSAARAAPQVLGQQPDDGGVGLPSTARSRT